ncbi:MAG: rhomboid family intramembrane serine protease [Leptospiraceae bacterium]|nr:rhomboid family intramembrane serine protease [Leptospiraceae bacterium]
MIIIYALIGLNLVVSFLGFQALQGMRSSAADFLFEPYEVHRGRNLKGMLISNFAHANWFHLLLNMYVLYISAPHILFQSNLAGFFLILLAALVGGDLLIYFRRKDDPHYRSLGASGYVTGLLFAMVVFNPGVSFGLLFIPGLYIPGPVFAILFLAISWYMMKKEMAGISHEGHIGGAIGGFAAAVLVAPQGLAPLLAWFLSIFL